MTNTITNKFMAIFGVVAIAFGLAFTALAYTELQIESHVNNENIEFEVQYEDGGTKVDTNYSFNTLDLDEAYALLADELGLSVDEVKSVADEDNEDVSDDNEMSDDDDSLDGTDDEDSSEDEEMDGTDDEESDEEMDDENDTEDGVEESNEDKVCDVAADHAAGWGVAKKCVDDEDYTVNNKLAKKVNRFEDFGKSNDKIVLQNQLQELLLILIQLLQQQMALSETSS